MPPERPVKIYQEQEGCTYDNLAVLLPRIEALGFKQIIVHKTVNTLIPNTIYICPDINKASFTKDENTVISIRIPMQLTYVQSEYYPPANSKGKRGAIEFESISGEIIGHYHEGSNSLSICDATHVKGKNGVESFAPFIEVIEKFKELTKPKFNEWVEAWVKEVVWPEILMGADPEFEIATADGSIISACTVWPNGGTRSNKKFGHDGEPDIGEIRPNPKPCPLQLTKEIKRLLSKIVKDPRFPSDGQMWVGGGMKLLTAGHIHVSGLDPDPDLLDILGIYIAKPMHKSMNIDGGSDRKNTHYRSGWDARNTDRIRPSDDGDPNHWEWRPLMAFHFDEETTNAVHCLFYCIVETYRRNRNVLRKDKVTLQDYEKLEFYDKYKKHVDTFIDKFVKGVQKMEGIDVLDNWFKDRPKEKKISFVCLHQQNGKGTAGGKCYTGLIPQEMAEILDDLRARPFPNLTESFRCNVTHYNGSGIRYAGVNDEGAKIIQSVVEDKMIGCDFSEDILRDFYRGKHWDFAFFLPELSFKTDKNRKILADMIYESIFVTLKERKDVT